MSTRWGGRWWRVALASAALVAVPTAAAQAFCGFYVSGADTKLFNNATQVVLLRDGTRTVLSMQNNYEGPPENFAMVVPVPVVLQKENVKTLPRDIFDKVDTLAAPRLVEYWEQDPCQQPRLEESRAKGAAPMASASARDDKAGGYGVKIEAQFTVGEYEVVVLSADDSTGLDRWLRDNKYHIPEGAEPVLKPYVEAGMRFFVAKVDTTKVKFETRDGREMAMLSPLRFHYDSDTFNLPVRLGLLNSNGKQDLIVHILSRGKRFDVANYPGVTIPTNFDVSEDARGEFGAFYAALFDKTLEEHPKAVVTEYAWAAQSCDPCPTPGLDQSQLSTLGADVLTSSGPTTRRPNIEVKPIEGEAAAFPFVQGAQGQLMNCYQRAIEASPTAAGKATFSIETNDKGDVVSSKAKGDAELPASLLNCAKGSLDTLRFNGSKKRKFDAQIVFSSVEVPAMIPTDFVLTRLHARYGKDTLGEDLVFKEAKPIFGGREVYNDKKELEHGATETPGINNFQARYAIRHPWKGPIKCANPVRGIWGGPPAGENNQGIKPARDLAFAKRGGIDFVKFLRQDVPELKITGIGPGGILALTTPGKDPDDKSSDSSPSSKSSTSSNSGSGCSCEATGAKGDGGATLVSGLLAILGAIYMRRRRP